jgi:predicted HAD superfamily hydrolase
MDTTIDFPNLDNYKVISFDIFDTAVFRMVFEPRDVFLLMEEELVEKYGKTFLGFSDLRFKSELETVEKVWKLDRSAEINLDEIYRTLFFFNPALKQFDEELKETEFRTELSVMVPSYQLLAYFNKARQLQKDIIFVF